MNIFVNLAGTLMNPRAFDQAHEEWFSFMAKLLGDSSIEEFAGTEDYFPLVFEVMRRYLGKDLPEEELTVFARNLYAMMCIERVRKDDLQSEFAIILKELSKEHKIILVTNAPSVSVNPILAKLSIRTLFDDIIKSPLEQQPDSESLLKLAVNKHGKGVYIGDNPKHLEIADSLALNMILVQWFECDEFNEQAVHQPAQILPYLKTLN